MSQDLFAAFGSEHDGASKASGPAQHNPKGPPKPLNMEEVLNAKPYDEFTTNAVAVDEDDDDFGDFEDASPQDEETKAAILKARMGSPLFNPDMPFFETAPTSTAPLYKPKTALKPASDLPFKAKEVKPAVSSASSISPAAAPKPTKALPFKPKPVEVDPKTENIGQHPFAGRMDMLFADDEDDYDAGADDLNVDLANDPEAAMAYSKKLIADAMAHQKPRGSGSHPMPSVHSSKEAEKPSPNKLRKKSQYAPTPNADVLFDAENVSEEEDEDDWGSFEGDSTKPQNATSSHPAKSSVGALGLDLLGLEDTSAQWASSTEERHTRPETQQSAPSITNDAQDDDAWDDFEDTAPPPAQQGSVIPSLPKSTINIAAPADPTSAPTLPPTNIPPPAVLLSIFPSLFSSAQSALFDTLTKIPHDQKQELLNHSATHQFLRGFIGLSNVLAHIIAGRKQRWKRDQFLAQGMRIGPAAAGGKGGMKLAGVDKSEVAKEDREALDAVRQWRSIVGKLRSAVAGANAGTSNKLPPVPEISEQMPVKVLKPAEGGISASHACALCGLKREERVPKMDEGVNDSFGEWWVEGMNMHLLCKNFWDEHSGKMRSR